MHLGQVGSLSSEISLNTVSGEFNVVMAVYEDASYTTVVADNFAVIVPDHVYLGIALTNGANFLLQTTRCWVTSDSDPNNLIQYNVMDNGCPNPEVSKNVTITE